MCSLEETRLPVSTSSNDTYPPFNNFASMYKSTTSFPWPESHAVDIASGNNDINSNNINGFGSFMEWPSMNNLVAAAETLESVDDLANLGLAASNSFSISNIDLSTFNLPNLIGELKPKDDIGYPIDELDHNHINNHIDSKVETITANLNAVNHIYNPNTNEFNNIDRVDQTSHIKIENDKKALIEHNSMIDHKTTKNNNNNNHNYNTNNNTNTNNYDNNNNNKEMSDYLNKPQIIDNSISPKVSNGVKKTTAQKVVIRLLLIVYNIIFKYII